MSLTQTTTTTTTTTRMEAMGSDRRLQHPAASSPTGCTMPRTLASVQQVRLRTALSPAANPVGANPRATNPHTLTRRFSFVWPFISKDSAAATEPFLKSRCSQLLRQFPAFLSGRQSTRAVQDVIPRIVTQLKAVWLVLAVYMSLLVLACLSTAVLYTFVLAKKPPGLWFLVGCIVATGALATVSLSARQQPRRQQQQQQQQQRNPIISVN